MRARHKICLWSALALFATTAFGEEKKVPGGADQKDKELGQRLIRQALGEADEDLMDAIIRLMNEASYKLEIEFDAGRQTQELQRGVVDRLDEAIKVAAARRRPGQRMMRPARGDKRRRPSQAKRKGEERDVKPNGDPGSKSASATSATGTSADGSALRGNLRESRRSWGHLPQREREEVLQGIGEGFLERYRDWIERYYRALQEAEE